MLVLYDGGAEYPILRDDYSVHERADGQDELYFDISIWDEIYPLIKEEAPIVDRGGQRYLIKRVDAGPSFATVVAVLDLDEWRAGMLINYSNGSANVVTTINGIKPDGWTVLDHAQSTIRRTISGTYTPLEVCAQCMSTYEVYLRWDTAARTITIVPQTMPDPVGAFATRELNLREINYKGKSTNFATRIYAYGKKDDAGVPMTLQGKTINGAVYPYPYVEDRSYADKIISVYWQDDRYTDPQSLYDDAAAKLREMAVPERSYDCSIVDLKAVDPDKYAALDFSLYTAAVLIDDSRETAITYQVVERHVWPYWPEKNEVIFARSPQKITDSVMVLSNAIHDPNSDFNRQMDAVIASATSWLSSSDGYVVAVKDDSGTWKELLFLDAPDTETAENVLRINTNGIGFSHTGIDGPYVSAWTIDGVFNADFIQAGTISADRVDIKGKVINADRSDEDVLTASYSIVDPEQTGNPDEVWYYNLGLSASSTIASLEVPEISYSTKSELANDFIQVWQESNGDVSYVYLDSGGGILLSTESGGTVTQSSVRAGQAQFAVSTSTSSDARLKHDIEDISADRAKAYIMGLRPRTFKYNNGSKDRPHHGFVAQELIEAMRGEDWGVYYQADDGYYAVRYEEIIADLVAVVQDQERRIKALEDTDDGK